MKFNDLQPDQQFEITAKLLELGFEKIETDQRTTFDRNDFSFNQNFFFAEYRILETCIDFYFDESLLSIHKNMIYLT